MDAELAVLKAQAHKPYIKKFTHEGAHFIYDVNTNGILKVNEVVYDLVDEAYADLEDVIEQFKDKYPEEHIREYFAAIKRMQTKGYFTNHRPRISLEVGSLEDIKLGLTSLNQLILELTRQCDLRCKYCPTSGYYASDEIRRRVMPFDIARKSVDYFIERTRPDSTPSITFYGGEPLLKFDLMEKIVNYIKRGYPGRDFAYSFTTNGTQLRKEKIFRFLIENKITILVSLDGPRDAHNRYRVFSNGKGSFDRIMANLQRLKEYHAEYYRHRVRFNVVVAPPYDYEEIYRFFNENAVFAGKLHQVRTSLVTDADTTFFEDFAEDGHLTKLQTEVKHMRERYDEALIKGDSKHLKLENDLFLKDYRHIANRPQVQLKSIKSPNGQCSPGAHRLFVDTKGTFQLCEKADKKPIGDVYRGFDFIKVRDFQLEYERFFKDCKYCWCLRFCHKCVVSLDGDFDEKIKDGLCQSKRKWIAQNLVSHCKVSEQNPKAFEAFNEFGFF